MSKKIFISYSWGTKEHQDWVVNLGKRLMGDSVDVELDKWSLKDGHDVHSFMESMVKSKEIFRVLIICDKIYKEKANDRQGGVGTETQIITPEIYSDEKQEKFIPIVVERDEYDKPYLPIFLSSRKYIDFSNDDFFEDSYEELLRNILEAPSIPKPKLGSTIPLYITETKVNNIASNSILRTLENQFKKNPEKINNYSSQFLEQFLTDLWEFQFKSTKHQINEFGDDLINNLKSYKLLRDDFIKFLFISTSTESELDVDLLIEFFEKKTLYERPREEVSSFTTSTFDNYKIIFHELFIYTISVCLKNKNYKLLEDLLQSKYYFKNSYGKNEGLRFTKIYTYHRNLENYYETKYQKTSGFGNYIITNLFEKISREDIILGDTICHYIGELFGTNDYEDSWFPATYIFNNTNSFDFFERISSERHFNKVKGIFAIETPEELKELIIKYSETKKSSERIRYGRGYSIPFFHEVVKSENIAINR
ncbi:toll/interleukin-1 receptor domain-containing protein [Flavobacterium sp. GCM10027622]|uniref:toll/interleukin-1 receptor domain-containing protein n=1 Tax=unclassified Flavobacterium TaxID=196869 RepID=UPI003611F3B5